MKQKWKMPLAGALAGAVNGLFGAGGGMVLVPLLTMDNTLEEAEVFPASVSIILPICVVSLALSAEGGLPLREALPYLIGSFLGGILAGLTGNRIKVTWLHRALGILVLWGGFRYLC